MPLVGREARIHPESLLLCTEGYTRLGFPRVTVGDDVVPPILPVHFIANYPLDHPGQQIQTGAGLESVIDLYKGDIESIGFQDESLEALTVLFGVRHFGDHVKGIAGIRRALAPAGRLVVLEFSKPPPSDLDSRM